MTYGLYVTAPVAGERVAIDGGDLDTLMLLAKRLLDTGLVESVEIMKGKPPGPTPNQERAVEVTTALMEYRERQRE